MTGDGVITVTLGRHTFPSAITTTSSLSLVMSGGSARLLAPGALRGLSMLLGDLELHSSGLNVTQFSWSGGALRGFPLLGSSILVHAGGHAVISSNDTLTLDGVALLVDCPLRWTSGDLMMRNVALLRIKEEGQLLLDSGDREVRVISDSSTSRIEVEGIATLFSPATIHTAFINTGHVSISNHSAVTFLSDYIQDSASSSLHVDAGSVLTKLNGDVMIVRTTDFSVDGVVHGNVEVGGRLVISGEGQGGLLDGDLLLTPTSSLLMRREGRALVVNGTVHAAGSVVVEDGKTASSYHLITALSTVGTFIPSTHHRISYDRGTISLHPLDAVTDDEEDSSLSFPTLYLPFVRLPDSLSSLASLTSHHDGMCAVTESGRGVLGWSQETTAAVMAVLVALFLLSTGVSVCLACTWWSHKRKCDGGEREEAAIVRAGEAPGIVHPTPHDSAQSTVEDERERQRGQEEAAAAVAYM